MLFKLNWNKQWRYNLVSISQEQITLIFRLNSDRNMSYQVYFITIYEIYLPVYYRLWTWSGGHFSDTLLTCRILFTTSFLSCCDGLEGFPQWGCSSSSSASRLRFHLRADVTRSRIKPAQPHVLRYLLPLWLSRSLCMCPSVFWASLAVRF